MAILPKTPGLHHVALRVRDFERAKRFYLETLGFEKLMEKENLFLFKVGGLPVALRGPETDTPANDRFNPHRVGLDHLALACEDEEELERVAEALKRAGIENTGIKRDTLLGKLYVAFKDPDGIKWEFYMV